MELRAWGCCCSILLCVLFCVSTNVLGQRVIVDDLKIVCRDNGYAVSGNIIAQGLNPLDRVVISDNVTVVAEIRMDNDSEYPMLPDAKSDSAPKWAQTPYRIGSSYLTSRQAGGRGIQTFTIAHMNMRQAPVWKSYGGADKWRIAAPEKTQAKFESLIPLQYGDRPMRIRATLEQTYVTDKTRTQFASLRHDTIQITPTLEIYVEDMKRLYPIPKLAGPEEKPEVKKARDTTKPADPPKPKPDPRVVHAKRMQFISLVTSVEIDKPRILKDVQKQFFEARDKFLDDETEYAKKVYIAWHRKLIETVMHTPIIKPEFLGDVQLDYLRIAR